MRNVAAAKIIFEKLASAKKPLLVAHKKPDGDTLGAMLAIYNFLRDRDQDAYAFCVDAPAAAYSYFPRVDELRTDSEVFRDRDVDIVCVFDAGDLNYAGIDTYMDAMPQRPFIANFDHHITNELFGDQNVVAPDASSTAEVVHGFFMTNGIEPSREMSVCLMTGLLTDTSNFSNPATTVKSMEVASDLLLRGASIKDITRRLIRNKPIGALRLWGAALERLKWDPAERTATTALFLADFEEHDVDEEYLEGLSNFLNHLLMAEVVLVLKEEPNGRVKGSYRSVDKVDVAQIARKLGGGGHKKAAGFTVLGRIVEEPHRWHFETSQVKEKLEEAIEKNT